jgi:ribosomal protein S21
VVVLVRDNNIEAALKALRKEADLSGLRRLMRSSSPLFAYYRPADRKRIKSQRARTAVRVRARKAAVRDRLAEAAGR